MKFSQMTYARPDADALKRELEELTGKFAAAADFETADSLFLKKEELISAYSTMHTLAQIRHD